MTAERRIIDEIAKANLLESVLRQAWKDAGWQDGFPSKEGEIIVKVETKFRWLPYAMNSSQAKQGHTGRWQRLNDRSVWETVPAPTGLWKAIDK